MPTNHSSTLINATTTFLFVILFTTALFPGLFVSIVWSPYHFLFPPKDPAMAVQGNVGTAWFQKQIVLEERKKGSYLIQDEILRKIPEIQEFRMGLVHLFIQHTSCALSLNENWDSDVRKDMTKALDRVAPEGDMYLHDAEGADDMPAHVKSSLVGADLTIPIQNGRLATGTWQGVWLLEFREHKHQRKVMATIWGQRRE